jgi:hypothetical protein
MKLITFTLAGTQRGININPEFVVYVRDLTQSTSAMPPVTRIVVMAQELNPRAAADHGPITPGFIDVAGNVPDVVKKLTDCMQNLSQGL